MPSRFSNWAEGERPPSLASARNRCSVLVYSSCRRVASACADCMIWFMRGDSRTSAPYALGIDSKSILAWPATCTGSSVILRSSDGTMPFSCSASATSRCSGVISAWVISDARFCAVITASCAFSVSFLKSIVLFLSAARCPLLRGAVCLRAPFVQFRERFVVQALFGRQLRGQLDLDARVRVAFLVALADRRHALSLQAEDLAVLCQRRDLQPHRLARDRRHFDFAAEDRGRHRQRGLDVEVASLPLEEGMRREPDPQI